MFTELFVAISTAVEAIFDSYEAYLLLQLFLFSYGCHYSTTDTRNPSIFQQRCSWDSYTNLHGARGTLKRRLRMDHDSFDRLLAIIYDDLVIDELMAQPRGGPIIPELCLFCTLWYLAGASYLDICDIAGISKSSFYRVVWKTITAICKCDLNRLIENLPFGCCVIADAAYEATEKLVTIIASPDCLIPANGNFNFYASQCRIRVEMAFGMMQNKWGILQWPISCSLANVGWLIQAIGGYITLWLMSVSVRTLQRSQWLRLRPQSWQLAESIIFPQFPLEKMEIQ